MAEEKRVYTEDALRAGLRRAYQLGFTDARGGELSAIGQRQLGQLTDAQTDAVARTVEPIGEQSWEAVPVLSRMLSRWTERQPRILRSALVRWRDTLQGQLDDLAGARCLDAGALDRLASVRGQMDAVLAAIESDVFVIGGAGPDA